LLPTNSAADTRRLAHDGLLRRLELLHLFFGNDAVVKYLALLADVQCLVVAESSA